MPLVHVLCSHCQTVTMPEYNYKHLRKLTELFRTPNLFAFNWRS